MWNRIATRVSRRAPQVVAAAVRPSIRHVARPAITTRSMFVATQSQKKEFECWTNPAFFTSPTRLDSLADAQEQIKKGTEYLNQGSLDMAMHSYHKSVQIAPSGMDSFSVYANACWQGKTHIQFLSRWLF